MDVLTYAVTVAAACLAATGAVAWGRAALKWHRSRTERIGGAILRDLLASTAAESGSAPFCLRPSERRARVRRTADSLGSYMGPRVQPGPSVPTPSQRGPTELRPDADYTQSGSTAWVRWPVGYDPECQCEVCRAYRD